MDGTVRPDDRRSEEVRRFEYEYEFVAQPRIVGHGPTLFAGLSRYVDLKLVDRLEFGSGAVALRYEPTQSSYMITA